ncbi:nitrogen regulatory protein OTam [Histoplasma capsulatum var. duboisii H88]|uniref:Nitrogen regulatory protein OTam n=1 Tax=Ajellomyces capsulatus (strain H88) TaxID=544711 RepID=A0A8A1LVY8_AJEC8|nr:nitrogen regulatory protein OTam [Histoplasma capsulatum var. duboisii H88]
MSNITTKAEQAQTWVQAQVQSQLGKRKFEDEFGVGYDPNVEEDELPLEASFVTSQHIGMTTELEPLLLDFLTLDHNNERPLATSRVHKVADDGTFMRVVDGFQARHKLYSISIETIESAVSPFGPILIDSFFQHAHPAFSVLIEDAFRHSYQTRRNLSPPLLVAVYLVALEWLDAEVAGANSPPGSESEVQTPRRPDSARLERMATRLLNESLAQPHITTIQAGLLLSQKPTLNTPVLIAQLVTAGYDLGLHQNCNSWNIPSWEKGLRKRLSWALYVQDKWCALVHGRPSHIFAANWAVKELVMEDFADINCSRKRNGVGNSHENVTFQDIPSSVRRGARFFRHFVTLTVILSEILDTFYTLQATSEFAAAGPQRTRIILERAKPIQIRLKRWFACLPDELRIDHYYQYSWYDDNSRDGGNTNINSKNVEAIPNTNSPCYTDFNGGLHLAYFATEITLHRSIIRSLGPDSADPYLSHICRSAAKSRLISAMDFVNRLRPAHLRSFWPSSSRTNFALISSFGILLGATALTSEEEEFYRMRLDEYRWTLSVSCKDAKFLARVIEGLDAGMGLLENVPPKKGLGEVVADGYGDGGRNRSGKGLHRVRTIPSAVGEIINIVENNKGLDVDPEPEVGMEDVEAVEEMEMGEYAYPHLLNPARSPRGAKSRNPLPRHQRGHHQGLQHHCRTPLVDNASIINTEAPVDSSKLQRALESASRNLNQSSNHNRSLGQRSRNANASVNVGVGDPRSSSLPPAVPGLVSPATSMEGEGEKTEKQWRVEDEVRGPLVDNLWICGQGEKTGDLY